MKSDARCIQDVCILGQQRRAADIGRPPHLCVSFGVSQFVLLCASQRWTRHSVVLADAMDTVGHVLLPL
eukprot:COSAG01_NODE_2630_length_7348_cov_32.536626_1_plen_68_part_10